jgi:basic membrane protein A and related proteins
MVRSVQIYAAAESVLRRSLVKRSLQAVALVGVAALALAACSSKSSPGSSAGASTGTSTSASSSAAAFKACMVLDIGGVDDHSFNQTSWAGMVAANTANPNIQISHVDSNSQNDYAPNLEAEHNAGCKTIIAVGGLMADAVKAAAIKHPDQQYAEVDNSSQGLPNVYGIQYNTAQGGFLGGYLAAGMTKTGKVATYGGLNIPPVTIYMDGFYDGVQYYNTKHGTHVQVLGWATTNQKGGTFANSFTDQGKGKSITQAFVSQGADIVFPVAGGTGLGSGAAAQASGGKLTVIWVDVDGCISAANYCPVFLTSVTKNLAGGVSAYLTQVAAGASLGGQSYIGTLTNAGTGISPFHDFAAKVPSALQSELAQVKAGIISGSIPVSSPSQPK